MGKMERISKPALNKNKEKKEIPYPLKTQIKKFKNSIPKSKQKILGG